MRKIKLGAIAVALALTTALPINVPHTAGLIGTPAAQAGVIGSIKGAAKKVGGAVKSTAKAVGSTTATGTRKIGAGIKAGALKINLDELYRDNAKLYGGIGKSIGKGVAKGAKATGVWIKDAGKEYGSFFKNSGKGVAAGASYVGRKVRNTLAVGKLEHIQKPAPVYANQPVIHLPNGKEPGEHRPQKIFKPSAMSNKMSVRR